MMAAGRTVVGQFRLGPENVEVHLIPGSFGGNFCMAPEGGGVATIHLSDYGGKEPERLSEVLLHEAFELTAARMHLRYGNMPSSSRSSADYLFVMNHEQLTEVLARVGLFIHEAFPAVLRVAKTTNQPNNGTGKKKRVSRGPRKASKGARAASRRTSPEGA
jgi:hypothetical protein